jgi:uncharacterized protein YndB with AHSA1/START domain
MKDWYRLETAWETEVPDHDPRVGGHTSIVFGGDEKYREDITYTELDRPNRIVYEEKMGRVVQGDFFITRVIVTFEAQDGKTLLTLVQEGFQDEARRDAHQGGWPQFLERLEQVVQARRAS